jgi:hypothetical protein
MTEHAEYRARQARAEKMFAYCAGCKHSPLSNHGPWDGYTCKASGNATQVAQWAEGVMGGEPLEEGPCPVRSERNE